MDILSGGGALKENENHNQRDCNFPMTFRLTTVPLKH